MKRDTKNSRILWLAIPWNHNRFNYSTCCRWSMCILIRDWLTTPKAEYDDRWPCPVKEKGLIQNWVSGTRNRDSLVQAIDDWMWRINKSWSFYQILQNYNNFRVLENFGTFVKKFYFSLISFKIHGFVGKVAPGEANWLNLTSTWRISQYIIAILIVDLESQTVSS